MSALAKKDKPTKTVRKALALSSLVETFRKDQSITATADTIITSWRIWSRFATVAQKHASLEGYWNALREADLDQHEGHIGIQFQEWITSEADLT